MSDLRARLRDAPVPDEDAARARARAVVAAAAADRPVPVRRRSRARIAAVTVACGLAAVAGAGAAAPGPREAVGELVRELVRADPAPVPRPLTRLPGGGRLLVRAGGAAWIVGADGVRRRLGAAGDATWSAPLGRFVALARGVELVVVDTRGTVRWAIARDARVRDPRWAPDGQRIAYRTGGELRAVNGDGTGDGLVAARVAPVAPAWRPGRRPARALAWAGLDGRVLTTSSAGGGAVQVAGPGRRPLTLGWTRGGRVVVARPDEALVGGPAPRPASSGIAAGPGVRPVVRAGAGRFVAAAVDPGGRRVAVLRHRPDGTTDVLVAGLAGGGPRRLLTAPGRLTGLAWSPDGARVLVGWPAVDQWLVLATGGGGTPRAIAGVRQRFGGTPRLAGWVR